MAPCLLLALGACAPLDRNARRDAPTPLACMRTVVRERVPVEVDDKLKHCLAAGFIARHCSVLEARTAAWGKEFTDLFDGGDPSTADLRADRAGIRCARAQPDDDGLRSCCQQWLTAQ
ncbi:MAG: hypothetical protein QM718_09155 [Steroidobacteraceae bacterium]